MTTILILIHGGALSSRMFLTLTPKLEDLGYSTIITPDLPGHGTSKSLGPFTFPRSTAHVHSIVDTAKRDHPNRKILLVGINLGGQAVLDVLTQYPDDVDAAVVSGASVAPPSEDAKWEMPRMPESDEEKKFWMDIMMEDVGITGLEAAQAVQQESFGFKFEPEEKDVESSFPPVLVLTGEGDVAMARRDEGKIFDIVRGLDERSERRVLHGAWHNHSIDVPEQFAKVIEEWDGKVLRG